MTESIQNTLILAGVFGVLFASAEVLYHPLKVRIEITRKYVHILTGVITLAFPTMIGDKWLVLVLCVSFAAILLASKKMGLLKSINAVKRETKGSLLYPVVVFGCYLVYDYFGQFIFYYMPILMLAFCDPMGALVGRKWPVGWYSVLGHEKTAIGSATVFISAIATAFVLLFYVHEATLTHSLILTFVIAGATTISEALFFKGYDNISIPASALLVLIVAKRCFEVL
jgi:dolichol kinase